MSILDEGEVDAYDVMNEFEKSQYPKKDALTPLEWRRYGRLDPNTAELVVVGYFVDDNLMESDPTDPIKIAKCKEIIGSGISSEMFKTEVLGIMYDEVRLYFQSKGQQICREDVSLLSLINRAPIQTAKQNALQNASNQWHVLEECRAARDCYPKASIVLLTNMLLTRWKEHAKPNPMAPLQAVQPDETSPTMPAAPTDDELRQIYKGTAFGVFIDKILEVAPIRPILPIFGALALQSAVMTPCIKVRDRRPSTFGMLVANPSSGKGTVLRTLDSVRDLLKLQSIDQSSTKTLLKNLGSSPWGTLTISEFEPYLKKNSWLADTIPIMNSAYDENKVSLSSETTGRCCVYNSAMSFLACIQNNAFFQDGVHKLLENGFLSRSLLAVDDTVLPENVSLGSPSNRENADAAFIANVFQAAYSWLPSRMTPSPEKFDNILKGKIMEKIPLGIWVHPDATVNISVKPHESLWQKHTFSSTLKYCMERLVKNYLPLLSIPFETVENLKAGIITSTAQARGERVLLAFYHHLLNATKVMPANEGESLIGKILAKIRKNPGINRRNIQRDIKYNTSKVFLDAMSVIVERGLAQEKVTANPNGTSTYQYWIIEQVAPALPPLPTVTVNGFQVDAKGMMTQPPMPLTDRTAVQLDMDTLSIDELGPVEPSLPGEF